MFLPADMMRSVGPEEAELPNREGERTMELRPKTGASKSVRAFRAAACAWRSKQGSTLGVFIVSWRALDRF